MADGPPRMTAAVIKRAAAEHGGYATPELNDTLFLHYGGYVRLENLGPYTGVRTLYLENNGLADLGGGDDGGDGGGGPLAHMAELRSLFLQHNLLRRLGGGLAGLARLVSLNVSHNRLTSLDGVGCCAALQTLNAAHNALASAGALRELTALPALHSLDLSDNDLPELVGPAAAAVAAAVAEGDASGEPPEGSLLALLAALPALGALYLKGNPLVGATRHYRKAAVAGLGPRLRYLDDAPVDALERAATAAWRAGGPVAERAARLRHDAAEKAAAKAQCAAFARWQADVRARHAAELVALNAGRAAAGEQPLPALPAPTYVSYRTLAGGRDGDSGSTYEGGEEADDPAAAPQRLRAPDATLTERLRHLALLEREQRLVAAARAAHGHDGGGGGGGITVADLVPLHSGSGGGVAVARGDCAHDELAGMPELEDADGAAATEQSPVAVAEPTAAAPPPAEVSEAPAAVVGTDAEADASVAAAATTTTTTTAAARGRRQGGRHPPLETYLSSGKSLMAAAAAAATHLRRSSRHSESPVDEAALEAVAAAAAAAGRRDNVPPATATAPPPGVVAGGAEDDASATAPAQSDGGSGDGAISGTDGDLSGLPDGLRTYLADVLADMSQLKAGLGGAGGGGSGSQPQPPSPAAVEPEPEMVAAKVAALERGGEPAQPVPVGAATSTTAREHVRAGVGAGCSRDGASPVAFDVDELD